MSEKIKAKVKATGEVIEVVKTMDAMYYDVSTVGIDAKTYYDFELDFYSTPSKEKAIVYDEEFERVLDQVARLSACDCGDGFDEPAYDEKIYEGFKRGVKWLLSRQFALRMSKEEREGIRDTFVQLEQSYLSALKNLSQMKMFFGELFLNK